MIKPFIVALLFFVVSCGSDTQQTSCKAFDEDCTTTADCCATLACGNGKFGAKGACTGECSGPGAPCGPTHNDQICCSNAPNCVGGSCSQ